jgi:hypothetical protein
MFRKPRALVCLLLLSLMVLLAACAPAPKADGDAPQAPQATPTLPPAPAVLQEVVGYRTPGGPPELLVLPVWTIAAPRYRCMAWPPLVRVEAWWVSSELTGKTPEELENLAPDPDPACLTEAPLLVVYDLSIALENKDATLVTVSFVVANASRQEATIRAERVVMRDSAFQAHVTESFDGVAGFTLQGGGAMPLTLTTEVPPGRTLDTLILTPDLLQPPMFISLPPYRTPAALAMWTRRA